MTKAIESPFCWQRQYLRSGGQELINSSYSGPRLEQP